MTEPVIASAAASVGAAATAETAVAQSWIVTNRAWLIAVGVAVFAGYVIAKAL